MVETEAGWDGRSAAFGWPPPSGNLLGFLDAFKAVLAVANRWFGDRAVSLTRCKDFA